MAFISQPILRQGMQRYRERDGECVCLSVGSRQTDNNKAAIIEGNRESQLTSRNLAKSGRDCLAMAMAALALMKL